MIICGDALSVLDDLPVNSIDCCVTSPPYWGLRNYDHENQIGLEKDLDQYIKKIVSVFSKVKRIMTYGGTLWLVIGDTYTTALNNSGLKRKNLIGIPWRVAFALQNYGWFLRQDIIWHKPNPCPESVTDRCTKAHEYIFLFAKSPIYYFDQDAIKEKCIYGSPNGKNGWGKYSSPDSKIFGKRNDSQNLHLISQKTYEKRNKRSVWTVTTKPFADAHFAVFPKEIVEPCILAGCPENGTVLDPFFGSGTTGLVALENKRKFIGIEINQKYVQMAQSRLKKYKETKKNGMV